MADSSPLASKLLMQPLQLPNGRAIRNRLAMTSMSETPATCGSRPTDKLVTLHRRWASSGIALLMTGNVMIEDESGLPVLKAWAAAATDRGVAIWAQLKTLLLNDWGTFRTRRARA